VIFHTSTLFYCESYALAVGTLPFWIVIGRNSSRFHELDGIQVARFFEYGNSTSSQASVLVEPRCDSVISVFLLVFYPYRGILFLCSLKSSMLSGLPMKRESEKGLG